MKTLSVRLPEPLAGWLDRRAEALGCSQSDLVRQALEQQRQKKGRANNCRERLAELGGFLEGPRDLSSNPKHLEDFGK
jgi:Arc/MetJ-type ribon-helix-helix transcriptional regulator